MRVLRLPGLGVRCAVSDHALERYGQRVRPHMAGDDGALWADMRRLVGVCGVTSPLRPDWVREDWTKGEVNDSDLWLACGDIVLVIGRSSGNCPCVATTVLTKGGISDAARVKRNLKRSGRTYRKRKSKRDRLSESESKMPRRHVELPEPT